MNEPVSDALLSKILADVRQFGQLGFTPHARLRMTEHDMDEQDVVNVLRGGRSDGCDFENGSWRYRVSTSRMMVVVALRSESHAVVVTVWRMK